MRSTSSAGASDYSGTIDRCWGRGASYLLERLTSVSSRHGGLCCQCRLPGVESGRFRERNGGVEEELGSSSTDAKLQSYRLEAVVLRQFRIMRSVTVVLLQFQVALPAIEPSFVRVETRRRGPGHGWTEAIEETHLL